MENKFEVKNVKTFRGTEGLGFDCFLYRNGKRVAQVVDGAFGGEYDFYWNDADEPQVEVKTRDYQDKPHTYMGSPEEQIFMAHIFDMRSEPCDLFPEGTYMSADSFVARLVDKFETIKQIKKDMKKRVLYHTDSHEKGEYGYVNRKQKGMTFALEPIQQYLNKKYGEQGLIIADVDFDAFLDAMNISGGI